MRRDMLDLLADVGAPPRAQATGRVLGTSQPDARCQLVLFDAALAVVVKAKRGSSTTLRIPFDQLAAFQPDVRASGERAYQAWWGPDLPNDSSDEPLDDLRQSLAFAVEKTRRGHAFAALLEAAVRAQRPDRPRGRGATDTERAARPRMEPSELWAPFGPQELAAPGSLRRGTACDRLGGVIAGVYRQAAGKPEEQVRAVLEHELQGADLRVSSAYANELVRGLAATDPGPLKRLLAPTRWSKKRHDQAGPVAERFLPRAFDQLSDEMDAVVDRLLVVPGVSAADWHSCPVIGCDRSLAVTIDPWSEATMERVRQLAAPHAVRFQRPS